MALMKKTLNKLIGLTGYQIKNKKFLYEPDKNLIKSIRYFKINSVLDVGANKGQFALNLIKNGFQGNILSFEPLLDEHNLLIKSSSNYKKWIIMRKCALGKNNQNKKFYITGNRESSSLLKVLPKHIKIRPDSKIVKKEIVKVEKLDNFYNHLIKLKKNFLLKIDTQGSEIDVLIGSKKFLKNIKCLFIEVSLVSLYDKQKLWLEIIEYLKKYGYEIWSIDQLLRNNITGQTYQVDIFFYKK